MTSSPLKKKTVAKALEGNKKFRLRKFKKA